jgi:hypothetical protein
MRQTRRLKEWVDFISALVYIVSFVVATIAAIYGMSITKNISIPFSSIVNRDASPYPELNLRPVGVIIFFFLIFCFAATNSRIAIRNAVRMEAFNIIATFMSLLVYSWIALIAMQWLVIDWNERNVSLSYFIYATASCVVSIAFIYLRSEPYVHRSTHQEREMEYMDIWPMKIPMGEKTVSVTKTEYDLKINPLLIMVGQIIAFAFLYFPSMLDSRASPWY